MPEPTLTRKVSVGAARRLFAQDLLSRAGVSITIASGLALAGVLTDRLVGPGLAQQVCWAFAGAAVIAGAAWAFARAWPRRARVLDGAIVADDRLALRDRLSSGLTLETRAGTDPFAALAVADAESVARGIDPRRAAPIRLNNWWAAWPVTVGACVAISFVTPMDLLTDKRIKVEQAERVAQASEAAKQVDEAAQELEKLSSEQQAAEADASPAAQLEALEKLKEQLKSGSNPDDAKAQAAGALTEAAEKLQQSAESQAESAEQTGKSLGELSPESIGEPTSAARKMGDALKGGDLQGAESAAAELAERLDQLSPQERQAEAARLEQLAQQLDDLARAKQNDAATPRNAEAELRRQGVNPEEARRLAEERDDSKVIEELKRRGFDEQTARDLAEKLAKERDEREARRQSADQLKDLADGVKQAQKQVGEGSKSDQPEGGEQKKADKPGDQQDAKQQPGDQKSPTVPQGLEKGKDQQQGEQGQSQQEQPGSQQGSQPGKQQPADQQSQGNQGQAEKQQGNQPGNQPGSQPQNAQGQPGQQPGQQGGEQGQQHGNQPGGDQGGKPRNDYSGTKSQPSDGGSGQPAQQGSGGQRSNSTQPSGAGGSGAGRGEQQKPVWQLKDRFAKMRQSKEQSQQQRQNAQRLRDQADKIVDSMSPEQRRQAAQQARSRAASGSSRPAPPLTDVKTTPEDFRRRETGANENPGEVLSEFNNPNAQVDRSGRASTRPMQPTAVEAAKSVQKAIEEKQLPARYRNVQKYFERAAEREKAPAAPTPPPAPAKDATDAKPK